MRLFKPVCYISRPSHPSSFHHVVFCTVQLQYFPDSHAPTLILNTLKDALILGSETKLYAHGPKP
jgi:hypothetical protein